MQKSPKDHQQLVIKYNRPLWKTIQRKVCVNCIRLLCTEIFRTVKQNQVIFVQSTLHQPGCQNQNKGAVTLCSQQGEATALQVLAAPTTISWPIFPFCILVSGEAPDKASHHLDVFLLHHRRADLEHRQPNLQEQGEEAADPRIELKTLMQTLSTIYLDSWHGVFPDCWYICITAWMLLA